MSYIPLSYLDIALAALLLAVNGALSIGLKLGLGRRLLVAATRMTVQLLLVGLVLKLLFATASPWLTGGVVLVMVGFAGYEITARQVSRFRGGWTQGIGATSMMVAGISVTLLALTTQIRADPWYDPRYAIPLLGMILGNAMTGVSVALDRLSTSAERERSAIEARLCLGHAMTEAMSTIRRDAVRAGLIPTINAMSAAGLVFLPGMMTGQILAGVDPEEAVKYQLLIMFLIAGGTGLGVVVAVWIAERRLTDRRHRLRLDRLTRIKGN
jgi:putative ABC transport system permease protein